MRNEKAKELDRVFNCLPIGQETINELLGTHRTIQQNITRFCVDWLNALATDWTIGTDDRNEAGVGIAKDLHKIGEARAILSRPLPYI